MWKTFLIAILPPMLAMSAPPYLPRAESNANHSNSRVFAGPDATPSFEDTTQEFILAIRQGSPLELLGYWSDEGVSFGVDGDPVSKQNYRDQVKQKGDLFCLFFDSDCLRHWANTARGGHGKRIANAVLYSYRDMLTQAKSATPKVSQRKEGGISVGDLKIRIENGNKLKGNEQTELEFAFALEKGTWKLTSVIYN
jgi:hypothetical protein